MTLEPLALPPSPFTLFPSPPFTLKVPKTQRPYPRNPLEYDISGKFDKIQQCESIMGGVVWHISTENIYSKYALKEQSRCFGLTIQK